jgi:predicted metal-binding membrane protein
MLLLHTRVPGISALCLARSDGTSTYLSENFLAAWKTGTFHEMAIDWLIMTLAMLPLLAVSPIRHVAIRSFAARRQRSILVFLAAACLPWLMLGLISLSILAAMPRSWTGNPVVIASGFIVAALWQITPMKHLALYRCHRTFPLAPTGWQADRDCAAHGFAYGQICVVSCWAMMLAATLASHGLIANLCIQGVALWERRARVPRSRVSAGMLIAAAVVVLIPVLISE